MPSFHFSEMNFSSVFQSPVVNMLFETVCRDDDMRDAEKENKWNREEICEKDLRRRKTCDSDEPGIGAYHAENKYRQKVEIRKFFAFYRVGEFVFNQEKKKAHETQGIHGLYRICSYRHELVAGKKTAEFDDQVPCDRGYKITRHIGDQEFVFHVMNLPVCGMPVCTTFDQYIREFGNLQFFCLFASMTFIKGCGEGPIRGRYRRISSLAVFLLGAFGAAMASGHSPDRKA